MNSGFFDFIKLLDGSPYFNATRPKDLYTTKQLRLFMRQPAFLQLTKRAAELTGVESRHPDGYVRAMLDAETRRHDSGVVQAVTAIGQADNGTGIVRQEELEGIAADYLGKPVPTHPDGYASCLLRRLHEAMEKGVSAVLTAAAQVYDLETPALI